jgi:Xaa-Pro aminopeptidase
MTQNNRIEILRKNFPKDIDWFLITNLTNISYLTGFSGSAGVLFINPDRAYFFTDFRYQEQAPLEVKNCEIVIHKVNAYDEIKKRNLLKNGEKVGFESKSLSYYEYLKLNEMLLEVKWIPTENLVEKLRRIKDKNEIESLKKAVSISEKVFEEILPLIKPNVSEMDIAVEINYRFKKNGADKESFDTIVASKERGAMPHARASNVKFSNDDMIVLDFGCYFNGYASDITRTIVLGKPSEKHREIYQVVLSAQLKAIEFAKPGMKAKELDAVARNYITDKGCGELFGHSLGHGVGLLVHEDPKISRLNEEILEEGNVITIEPGIYLPGEFGVRIEDMIVLTEDGNYNLMNSKKDLIIL